MKHLLDTHTAIWALLGNDEKLSEKAKGIIADRTIELAVSQNPSVFLFGKGLKNGVFRKK